MPPSAARTHVPAEGSVTPFAGPDAPAHGPSGSPPPGLAATGVPAASRAAALTSLLPGFRGLAAVVAIAPTPDAAERIAVELPLFLDLAGLASSHRILWLRDSGIPDGRRVEFLESAADRLAVAEALGLPADAAPAATPIIVTCPAALAEPLPAPGALRRLHLSVRLNDVLPPARLAERLAELDYDSEAVCEAPGQYALRGGLVDVWPVTSPTPYRLDFFGDTVEDIREFDPATQLSGERATSVTLTVAPTVTLDAAPRGLADYLPPTAAFVVIEPLELEAELSALSRLDPPAAPPPDFFRDAFQRSRTAAGDTWVALSEFEAPTLLLGNSSPVDLGSCETLAALGPAAPAGDLAESYWERERGGRARFFQQLANWTAAGDTLTIVFPRDGEEARAREILQDEAPELLATASFLRGTLGEGFRLTPPPGASDPLAASVRNGAALVFVTEAEFFGRRIRPRARSRRRARKVGSQVDQLLDFSDLAEGDHVVHLHHGVGIYRGVRPVDVKGESREALAVEFADGVTLYVPCHEAHLLTRYVGLTKQRPQLARIGSGRWEKTRAAAERAAVDLASQLLATQAARDARPGMAFAPDNAWQHEFEASFPYKETPDQLRAIHEVKADMEKTRPMDRLVCGDVGFGKTEVAIRAAFKAVMGGRQVAVLVPTTVLAQQHLNSFRERMAGFPVVVEMLSRFRTPKEQDRIAEAVAAGRVDILIGTHRILSQDIRFRDLGLVVIDEEQRFGVKHKETFKRLRAEIDVVTMSATPIPRTLHLALTGARDLSVIETAPAERLPIQTVVRSFDLRLIEDAIRHEVRRGGQVFYLHNRVQTIDSLAGRLREILPDLRITVGHGQMGEHQLERVMTEFVAGRFHVLVCTTIIESGIDIPNCNTIIIEGADRFGLSQLYQIRGRVGRFRQQAFAYLLLHRHARLLDAARQRLQAIRQHNQLGAGFRLAMRDLELRGAGNLLGAQQSGHIAGVGFDLYCQLLRQSVARLKGDRSARWVRCTLKLDFIRFGSVVSTPGDADGTPRQPAARSHGFLALRDEEVAEGSIPPAEGRLPQEYIGETRLRLDLYRRLAMADAVDQVRSLDAELRDRFGPLPEPVRILLLATEVRCRAERKGIQVVETEGSRLKCLRASGNPADFVMAGSRFPRLTEQTPLPRLREINAFLTNLPDV